MQEQAGWETRYAALRNRIIQQRSPSGFVPAILREAESNYVPIPISERLAQCIWYDQRLKGAALRTTQGEPVRVLFQGWWNLESGPDFHHATIQVGDTPARTGGIEVHLRADDWFAHGHDRDPGYNGVVLHVVLWQAGSERIAWTAGGEALPQVVLEQQLEAPLEALYDDLDLEAYPHHASGHGGVCSPVLNRLPAAAITRLLREAGDERFALKTRRFARWIHRAGAEQAFYEGWMEALGYKANKLPFRALARRVPLRQVLEHRAHAAALLFGVANFLPVADGRAAEPASQGYVKRLWNAWWKLRPEFAEDILPATAWRFHGLRPANHPHRRLGGAVALLKRQGNLLEKVLGAIESDGDPARFFTRVRDEYWGEHFTLGGRRQARAGELIGEARAREMVANIVLPFAAAYAEGTGDDALAEKVRARYAALRALPSNSVLRLAGGQLFQSGPMARRLIRTAREQQGLMQIFQDFCLNDKSACAQCQFAEMLEQWPAEIGPGIPPVKAVC